VSSPLSILFELPNGRRGFSVSVFSALARSVGVVLIAEAVVRAIVGESAPELWLVLGILGALLRGGGLWIDRSLGAALASESKRRLRLGILSALLRARGRPRPTAAVTVTRGIDDLDDYFSTVVPALSAAAVVPVVLLVRIVFSDLLSAVIIAVSLPLVPLFMVLIGRYTAESTAATMAALERLSDHLAELAEGLPVLIGLGRSRDHARRLRELGERYHRANLTTLRVAFLSSLALELITTVSVALVAVVIGLRLVNGTMDLSSGLFVLLIAPECFAPLRELGSGFHASENGRESRDRALKLLTAAQAAGEGGVLTPSERADDRVQQRVVYAGGTTVTWAGSIDSGPGVTAISGHSGAGKTTVLSALVGSLPADAQATVAAVPAAYMPQVPRMFATTVGAELDLFGLDPELSRRALEKAGLPTDPSTATAALSPGQQRRLALVRVLSRLDAGAEALVLDEPTAHLDADSADIVIAMIAEAATRHRVILASHDERVRALADTEIRPQKSWTRVDFGADEDTSSAEAANDGGDAPVGADIPVGGSEDLPVGGDKAVNRADSTRDGAVWEDHPLDEFSGPVTETRTAALRRRWSILNSSLPLFTPTMLLAVVTACASSLAAIALTAVSAWLIVKASYQLPIMLLMVAIVGVRFFGLSRSVLLYVSRLKLHSAIFSALTRLRTRLWEQFERVGMSDRKLLTSDSALRAMVADADDVRDLVPRTLFPPIVAAMVILGIGIAAALLDFGSLKWFIALAAANLIVMPLLVIRSEGSLARGIRDDQNRILTLIARALRAKDDLRINGADARVVDMLSSLEDSLEAKQARSARIFGIAHLWLHLSTLVTAVVVASTSSAPTEILAVPALMALGLNEVFASALGAFRQLPALGAALDALPAEGQVKGNAEESANSADTESNSPATEELDSLDLTGITVGWDETPVIDDLDLQAERHGWTLLCGDSGTGKSTTLSVLLRFLDPWAGDYTARTGNGDAVDMIKRAPEDLAGTIAWCPQESHIFRSTVRGNLALSQRSLPDDEEMFTALRAAGLSEWADAEGLERWVGDHGSEVSGGQRQRLAVARTLLTGADVIVLDEPTAHLDDDTGFALIDDLRRSLGSRMVVMVTHDRRLIANGDHVVDLGVRAPAAAGAR
jgi:ATP-binding cassette subfamily C protein CydCD